jgi:hypothetical protein
MSKLKEELARVLNLLGERCIMEEHGLTDTTKEQEVTQATAQIIEAFNKILPEKSDHTPQSKIHVNEHDHDYPCCATTEARNQAINQIERAINE